MSEVKLLGAWPSTYVLRARIALNLKSIEYQFLEEKIGTKSQLLLQSNPVYKKIPWFPSVIGIAKAEKEEARAAAKEEVKAGLQLLEEAFEKCSKGKDFFGGDTIGYLDIAFGGFVGWLKATEIIFGVKFLDSEKVPLLTGWDQRFCSSPAVKDVMPETQKLVEFAKYLRAKAKASPPPSN